MSKLCTISQTESSSGYAVRAQFSTFPPLQSQPSIAGLCCAALLAKYGHSVTVVESHYLAGEKQTVLRLKCLGSGWTLGFTTPLQLVVQEEGQVRTKCNKCCDHTMTQVCRGEYLRLCKSVMDA